MTAKKNTVCVGRYLVDVPAQAEVALSGAMLDGFDIATVEESEAAFRSRLEEREVELRARKPDAATDTDGGTLRHEIRASLGCLVGLSFTRGAAAI